MAYRVTYTGLVSGRTRQSPHETFRDVGRVALRAAQRNPGREVEIQQELIPRGRSRRGQHGYWQTVAVVTYDRRRSGFDLRDVRTDHLAFVPIGRAS